MPNFRLEDEESPVNQEPTGSTPTGSTPSASKTEPPSISAPGPLKTRPLKPRARETMPNLSPGPSDVARFGPRSIGEVQVLPDAEPPTLQIYSGLITAAQWLFWLTLMGTSFLLYSLLFNVAKGAKSPVAPPNLDQVASGLHTMGLLLNSSLIVLALCFLLLSFEEMLTGWIIFGVGVAAHLAIPWLIFTIAGRNAATASAVAGFRNSGFFLVGLGGAKLVWDGLQSTKMLGSRLHDSANVGNPHRVEAAQQERLAAAATIFSPCWHLSYCRKLVRDQCPAFLAKTKCWKFGRGCYCDDEMMARIIHGDAFAQFLPPRRPQTRKPPCGSCYIYLEHQKHKLSWISPLIFPVTISLTFFIWPLYNLIWNSTSRSLQFLWSGLSFNPALPDGPPVKDAPKLVGQIAPEQVAAMAQYFFGAVIGFFLFVALLRLVERAIFKLKW